MGVDPPPLQEVRLRTFDLFQVLRPREQTIRPVAIVDIDEASLKEIGQWPWPRTVVADLITRLKEQGALVIGFDVIFAEPDRMSPAVAAESFRGLDDETRTKLGSLPSNDDVLADAIKHARVVVGQTGSPMPQPRSDAEMALQTGFAFKGPDPTPFLVTFPGLLRNVLPIEQAAAGRGLFSINPERDGIVRRVPLVMEAQGVLVPSLSLEMLRVLSQTGAIIVHVDPAGDGVQSVAIRGLEIPTDERGQIFVHFNKSDPARYVSAKDVLQGKLSTDRLRGKLVLIGTSAIGLLDLKTTPVEAAMPGVDVKKNIVVAVVLNLVLPGAGYMYLGRVGMGIGFCVLVLLSLIRDVKVAPGTLTRKLLAVRFPSWLMVNAPPLPLPEVPLPPVPGTITTFAEVGGLTPILRTRSRLTCITTTSITTSAFGLSMSDSNFWASTIWSGVPRNTIALCVGIN